MHKPDTNLEQPKGSLSSEPPQVSRTDPSVKLCSLTGEPLGCVPMETTMAKPRAYKPTRNSNLGN